jgi:mono/diheme cytochrome c family protein/ketosteroid isomerase-like protein
MKALKVSLIVLALAFVAGAGIVYSGLFNVAADDPHWGITVRVLETARERSVAARARSVGAPPALDDPQLIKSGAQEYAEMCTGCHLAPGMKETELRAGLYPKPPELASHAQRREPAEAFWIIKHGLKMTGMPAWGVTHDDQRIWSMVAFLQKVPGLSPAQYEALVGEGDGTGHSHDDEGHGHSHDGDVAEPPTRASSANTAEPVAVVDRFFSDLSAGNVRAASDLLDPAVLIFESGGAERSRDEYAAHHMGSDAKFLKAVTHRLKARSADATGEFAWVASEATYSGVINGKPVNLISTETMVLRKSGGQWRIVHIHWSSHPAASAI